MDASHVEVVVLDRDRREHLRDVRVAARTPPSVGELDADKELCCRHRGNCDVVLIADDLIERDRAPLCVDDDRRVQNQSSQRRS